MSIGTTGSAQAYDAHAPILILDNVSLAGLGLPGTGTEADPFLIQNYEIDGAGGSAIAIYDTDLHVKIRNCLLSDSSWPSAVIQLENVKNVTVENNILVDSYVGVGLVNSHNNVIRNNTFENHNTGIVLEESDHNILVNNTCVLDIEMPSGKVGIQLRASNNNSLEMNNCSGNNDGIYLISSNFNALFANTCDNNDGSGITVDSSVNNTLTENICRGNYYGGIVLNSASSGTTGNNIDNNDCSGNALIPEWGAGIFLSSSPTYDMSNNTISNNELSGNYYGIWVLNAPNNTISSNTVNGNFASGIYLSNSSNSAVSSNDVFENVDSGIWIESSVGCTVESNTARNNYDGIYLDESDHNVLLNNDLPLNTYGIFIHASSFNKISFNECNSSTGGDGIYLFQSHFNGLFNNYCDGSGASHGIFLGASDQNTLLNNTCDSNNKNGIDLWNSQDSVIANNTCNGNQNGISVFSEEWGEPSIRNIIYNNTCNGNVDNGVNVQARCSYTIVTNNTCSDNKYGVIISASVNCEVANNTCLSNMIGIVLLTESDRNTLNNNNCSENAQAGIQLSFSSSNVVSNNSCNDNEGYGIYLIDSNENTISNNYCSDNVDAGTYLANSHWNVMTNNICLDNLGSGIYLSGSDDNGLDNNTCASPSLFDVSASVGIFLDWSDHNAIINNTCYNNGDGLHLASSEFNTVSGNNLSYNNNHLGTKVNIKVQASNNNVTNNTCLGSSYGLSISSGSDNRIEGNNFSYNQAAGIEVYNTNEHERYVIANNTCNGNGHGMYLFWMRDSIINNNTCEDNGKAGIYLDKRSINNLVTDNTIRNNGYQLIDDGYGMAFAGHGLAMDGAGEYDNCYGNIISNNTIEGNRLHGINITSATGNHLYGNVLIGNNGATSEYDPAHVQAYDSGSNLWNDTEHGNLWSDWTSPDANGDSIVDAAYLIDGGTNKDQMPLAVDVLITSPDNGFFTSETSVDITGIATSYFGVDHLTWHNAANDASGACSGTDSWTATVPLADGDNVITVVMVDLYGSEANASITVKLDIVPPTLEITYPEEGAYVGSSVTVTWIGSDASSGIDHYIVSIEGMFFNTTNGTSYTINDLADDTYTFLVSAYDAVGNYLDVSVTFTVDVTDPIVTIDSPADDLLSTDNNVTLTWISSDAGSGVDRYEVSWEGGSPVTLLPSASTYTFNGLSDGSHILTVIVYDKAGRSSSDTVTIMVDTQMPSLTITAPVQDGFVNSADVTVTWSGSDAGTGIAYYSASIEGLPAFNTTGNSCTFNDLADGTYTVLVSAYDHLGNYRDVTVEFTVDTVAPTLEITSPMEAQLFNASSVMVTWTSADANPGTAQVKVGSGAWATAIGQQFVLNGLANGAHRVYVKVADAAGNSVEMSVNLTVDTDAPEVRFVSPAEGSLVNSTTGIVEWEAEEAISSLNSTLLRVDGGAWLDMGENDSWDYSLEDGTHTIEVKVTDLAGNSASVTLNFTVDATAPTAECSPIGDDLELDQVILVEFSEVMNQTSVSITVTGVSGTLAWEGNSTSFTPSQLLYNSVYAVTVKGMDLAGNYLEINWTFTTRSVGNLTGVILDENGHPVANVTVTAGEFVAVTDENGRFVFLNLSVGTYMFEVDEEGYEPFTFNATIEQGTTVDEGTVEMVPDEMEGGEDDDGSSIWLYAIIAIVGLAIVGVAAFVLLRKK